jgi:exodeoxyribonuclease VII small subunit
MSFEERLARLEAIARELEGEDVPLARALALFEEGVECLRAASGELAQASVKLERLVERADGTFEISESGG